MSLSGGNRNDRRVVERTFALLRWFRRLRIRWEIRDDIHEAFLRLGRAIICFRRMVDPSLCWELSDRQVTHLEDEVALERIVCFAHHFELGARHRRAHELVNLD